VSGDQPLNTSRLSIFGMEIVVLHYCSLAVGFCCEDVIILLSLSRTYNYPR
jgi:hypothetical protein